MGEVSDEVAWVDQAALYEEDDVPSYIVGIGASAGGLDALQKLFSELPHDTGAGFVVVQHLSPDFKSMMDQLLSKHTKMPVTVARDGELVRANHVYLIPSRKNMIIAEGRLLTSDIMPEKGMKLPIDEFFRSLAEDKQHLAIGIILSGTGSDGCKGIRAFKETGSLVIVQDPKDAQFDGMPLAAVNTGLADLVAPVVEISHQLVSYFSHPLVGSKNQDIFREHLSLNAEWLKKIFQQLRKYRDIDFSDYKPSTVSRRIERRIGITGLSGLEEYFAFIQQHPQELEVLTKELLIGVTSFFRDTEAYETIQNVVLPEIIKAKLESEPIRIWVAGCSTGEEAYSLAILVDETLKSMGVERSVKIFATDVDPHAITFAGAGVYSRGIEADLSPERLSKYFVDHGDEYQVTNKLRQMVVFATHNLIIDPPFSNMDMATCRNVLIYFQNSAQKRALSLLHFALRVDGYLFLGISESLGDLESHFALTSSRSKIFRKNYDSKIPIGSLENRYVEPRSFQPVSFSHARRQQRQESYRMLSAPISFLLSSFAPPSIILNQEKKVIHVVGDVSRYTKKLPSGEFSGHISQVLREELDIPVATALHRAATEQDEIIYRGINMPLEETHPVSETNRIDLNVRRVVTRDRDRNGPELTYVISFITRVNAKPVDASSGQDYDQRLEARQRIEYLEQELSESRESLRTAVEELETTNEELQSTNEELMSANEELQSTNEELQSVNEELYTVNSEYQEKIEELTTTYGDLDNLLKATSIGVLFLDYDLRVRRFTPAATEYINLRSSDIGRQISDLSLSFQSGNLVDHIKTSLADGAPYERKICTRKNQHVLLRILPYTIASNTIQGVVVTLTNIDSIERTELALREREVQLDLVLKMTNVGCWSLDVRTGLLTLDARAIEIHGGMVAGGRLTLNDLCGVLVSEDANYLRMQLDMAVNHSVDIHGSYRAHLPDGNFMTINYAARSMLDIENNVSVVVGTCTSTNKEGSIK